MLAAFLSSNLSLEAKDYDSAWVRAMQYNDYFMWENHKNPKFKYRPTNIEDETLEHFKDREKWYESTGDKAAIVAANYGQDPNDKVQPFIEEIMEIIFARLWKNGKRYYTKIIQTAVYSRRLEKI